MTDNTQINNKAASHAHSGARLNIVCALHCEAKSVIDKLRLKKENQNPFDTYIGSWRVDDLPIRVTVLVTGIGAMSMAAGVAWLAAQQNEMHAGSVWLNVGSAGHGQLKLGEPFIVSMSQGLLSSRNYYPPQVARRPARLSPCMSLNAPSSDYPEVGGIDMEASAFFDIACRFAQAELVQSFKVVSDTPDQSIENLSANIISGIIQPHVEAVLEFSKRLLLLAEESVQKPSVEFDMPRIRATHSQRQQFKDKTKRLSFSLSAEQLGQLNSELLRITGSAPDDKATMTLILDCLNSAILGLVPVLPDSRAARSQNPAKPLTIQNRAV